MLCNIIYYDILCYGYSLFSLLPRLGVLQKGLPLCLLVLRGELYTYEDLATISPTTFSTK